MPYATADFLRDPLTFMNANLVVPAYDSIGRDQQSARIHEFCLARGGATGRRHGTDIPVWILRKKNERDPGAEGFFAYWCPYDQNQTLNCMLGNGARFMFTATMDGCSFGVGSQNGGNVRVAHSNEGRFGANREGVFGMNGARQFQRDEQANRLRVLLGNQLSIINPIHYMTDHDGALVLKSTTFGLHDLGRSWTFYTQSYLRAAGNVIYLRDVVRQI